MRTVKFYNWSKPLKERMAGYKVCGPYYTELPPLPGSPGWRTTTSGGAGGYMSNGELSEGSRVRLRVKRADEIISLRHTGWYCDDFQDQTIFGIVARLPRGRGFLAGWSMGDGMATSVEASIYADETSAARAADSSAEYVAEQERDYQAEQEAKREAEEKAEQEREAEEKLQETTRTAVNAALSVIDKALACLGHDSAMTGGPCGDALAAALHGIIERAIRSQLGEV